MALVRSHIAVLTAVLLTAAAGAAAQPPSREDYDRMLLDLRGRQQQKLAWQTEADQTRIEIARLNSELASLAKNDAPKQLAVGDKRLQLQDLSVRETELAARVGANRNKLSRLLGALELYGRNPPPALFVHPKDAKDAVRAAILIKALTPELQRRAQLYAREVEDARLLRRQVASGSAELFTAESELTDERTRIEGELGQRTNRLNEVTADVLIADRQIVAITQRAETLRRFLSGAKMPTAAATLAATPGGFRMPVAGKPVTRFADRRPEGTRSEGWTFRPDPGTTVVAPSTGLVEYAGPLEGVGNVVVMRLTGGYHMVLSGMGELIVKPGQSVAVGQPVGRMAKAGNRGIGSELPDLYLEVRKGNGPVDPAQFMQ